MRRITATILSVTALAVPTASAVAATTAQKATAKTKVVTSSKAFTGAPGQAQRWGNVDVTITVKKTTTTNLITKKTSVTRQLISVKVPVSPNHTSRSIFINEQALPFLIQEAIKAQSSAIDMVSGATDSSGGFQQSLQSAILKAKAW
jgi:uncharacterized protein with FMN-binding domain